MNSILSSVFQSKLESQIERTQHLIHLIPRDKLEWRPSTDAFRVCDLLGHLLDCLAGFCAALCAAKPAELAHFAELRELPVNHCCGIDEARQRISEYNSRIAEGFAVLSDEDLAGRLKTVFSSEGEPILTILLNNLEHLINHKYQLFFYLKLMGEPVGTPDLYKFDGENQ